MRLNSTVSAIVLIVWMGASTYWYVCKIKQDCDKKETSIIVESNTTKSQKETQEVLNKNKLNQNSKKEKEEIISSVKEKLTKGYTVYNFPKNSGVNNNIEDKFNEFADNLKLYLNENPNSKIELTGYTDNSGSTKTNLFFGKKRALFIKNILINKGLNDNIFTIKSMGEKNPIATNKTQEGRLKNRRVIIKLIDK